MGFNTLAEICTQYVDIHAESYWRDSAYRSQFSASEQAEIGKALNHYSNRGLSWVKVAFPMKSPPVRIVPDTPKIVKKQLNKKLLLVGLLDGHK